MHLSLDDSQKTSEVWNLHVFPALEIICTRRVKQKYTKHDEYNGLQTKPVQLPEAKPCKYTSDQSIEDRIAKIG